jgi:hypothetical protein
MLGTFGLCEYLHHRCGHVRATQSSSVPARAPERLLSIRVLRSRSSRRSIRRIHGLRRVAGSPEPALLAIAGRMPKRMRDSSAASIERAEAMAGTDPPQADWSRSEHPSDGDRQPLGADCTSCSDAEEPVGGTRRSRCTLPATRGLPPPQSEKRQSPPATICKSRVSGRMSPPANQCGQPPGATVTASLRYPLTPTRAAARSRRRAACPRRRGRSRPGG